VVQIVAIVTVVALVIVRPKVRYPLGAVTVFLLLFNFWMVITTFTAMAPSIAMPRLVIALKVFALAHLIILTINTREKIQALVWVLALSLSFYGAKGGVFAILKGGSYIVFGPENSYISDNNALSLAISMVIPFIYYLYTSSANKLLRLGLIAAGVLCIFSVVGTFSRGGLLALVAMGSVLLLKTGRRRILLAPVILALGLIVFEFMPDHWHARMQTIEQFEEDASAQGRLGAWTFAWTLAKDRPIVGGGFDVFFHRGAYNLYAPENPAIAPHSIVFQVLGEHGFVGLFFYAIIWIAAWYSASRVRSETKDLVAMKWAYDLAGMIQAAIAGYLVAGLFLSVAYFDLVAVLVALAVVLRELVEREVRGETPGDQEPSGSGYHAKAPASKGPTARRPTSETSARSDI
jgi:probable O-glycosylation ligase (exosortase A-associated)